MLDLQGTCPETPCLRGSPAYPPVDRALARLAEEVPAPGAKKCPLNAKCFFAIFGQMMLRGGYEKRDLRRACRSGLGRDTAVKPPSRLRGQGRSYRGPSASAGFFRENSFFGGPA
jgi:hypothetical protein